MNTQSRTLLPAPRATLDPQKPTYTRPATPHILLSTAARCAGQIPRLYRQRLGRGAQWVGGYVCFLFFFSFELGEGCGLKHAVRNPGKDILVPLTTSLYVPGKLASTELVLVDVGTGFYVEKVRLFEFLFLGDPFVYCTEDDDGMGS